MNNYLLMILVDEKAQQTVSPAEMKRVIDGHAPFGKSLADKGIFVEAGRLRPASEGKRIGPQDGPFAESKEVLGGYYMYQAESLDAAVAIAKGCPRFAGDHLEVREVMGRAVADKTDKPGKAFWYGVLGRGNDEKAWIKIMDRIDAETGGAFFDAALFMGGARLREPTSGKRIDAKGAVMDGPFHEAKEVIGGYFMMRAKDLDEAVRWAKGTPFLEHGALEVRELWR